MLMIPSLQHFFKAREYIGRHLLFNSENPTGRYKLRLDISADYIVGEQLLLLDQWEASIARQQQRFDTSQRGNWSSFRNERFAGRSLHLEFNSLREWNMPEADVFEFDYISGARPSLDQQVFEEGTFSRVLMALFDSECTPDQRILVLRQVSSTIFLTALQLRELLGQFQVQHDRIELFVLFFLRVVDMHNEKVFRVRFVEQKELVMLRDRIGYVTCFPFIQPEHAVFELDFSVYDQRLAANILFTLVEKEKRENLKHISYFVDGAEEKLAMGVPKSWDLFAKMPTKGVFRASYICAPEERKFEVRRQLFKRFGFWALETPEDEVKWWLGLHEAPEDVREYLEFLIATFPNVEKAFPVIDGPGGNGVINLREFEAAYVAMGCKKFESPDPKETKARIAAVFRYLDTSNEGSISMSEWVVLGQLWREMDMCITEFVAFLRRVFDKDMFLEEAWLDLDEDGDNSIDKQEWTHRIEQNLKFFGPSDAIFGFLDKDDEGTVSPDEFELLLRYAKEE